MANVLFKRGTQANLNTLKAGGVFQEGTFYLTTDSDRLYFAQSSSELVDLNQYIRTISSMSALPGKDDTLPGEFYYIEDQNILCIRNADNTGWTQLNPDTTLAATTTNMALTAGTNAVTVTNTVADSQNNKSTGSFTIAGGGVITVTEDPSGTIKISAEKGVDTTYDLSVAAHSADGESGAKIVLTSEVDATDVQTVPIVGTGVASVTQDGTKITVNAEGTDTTVSQLEFDANGALQVKVSSSTGTATGASVTPTIKVGATEETVKFVSGVADLPVYTISETDAKIAAAIQTADAMTYMGVFDDVADLTGLAKVNKGDTYKAGFSGQVNGKDFNAGDLLISNSPDGTAGNAVNWDVVASGNDQLIQVAVNGNGLKITDNGENIGAFTVVQGESITVTATGDEKAREIKVEHGAPLTGTAATAKEVTTGTTQGSTSELVIPVVDSISVDKNGHVTAVNLQKYKVTDTHLKINSSKFDLEVTNTSDAKGNVTNSQADIGFQISTEDGNVAKQTVTFESKSLVLEETADANGNVATSINLVWGSF